MRFTANYSIALDELLRAHCVDVDRLKCPAWPEVIQVAGQVRPVWVHFPLRVGAGISDAIDTEKLTPADWQRVELLMQTTGTHLVNLHLGPEPADFPDIPYASLQPVHIEQLTEALLRDVHTVTKRFGSECVIGENLFCLDGFNHQAASLPEVINTVVHETGCGLLLDISHARLAAAELGMDEKAYILALPVQHIKEIHVTGIQALSGQWWQRIERLGEQAGVFRQLQDRRIDHLPMTDPDWDVFEWAIEQIRSGSWAEPEVVSFEYGGVGALFETLTDREALISQIPRLYRLVHEVQPATT